MLPGARARGVHANTHLNTPLVLQAISKYGGTHTQAPNFAYKLVVRKFLRNRSIDRSKLNLSTVEHVFNAVSTRGLVRVQPRQGGGRRHSLVYAVCVCVWAMSSVMGCRLSQSKWTLSTSSIKPLASMAWTPRP